MNRQQQAVIDYLLEENRILRDTPSRRLRLTDDQRRRLAAKGIALGRGRLAVVSGIVTPDTILRLYRRLVAQKYDGSHTRRPGRPSTKPDIAGWWNAQANENPTWGCSSSIIVRPRSSAARVFAHDGGGVTASLERDKPAVEARSIGPREHAHLVSNCTALNVSAPTDHATPPPAEPDTGGDHRPCAARPSLLPVGLQHTRKSRRALFAGHGECPGPRGVVVVQTLQRPPKRDLPIGELLPYRST